MIGSWILWLRSIASHREIMQSYIVGDFGKMYTVDEEALVAVAMCDI